MIDQSPHVAVAPRYNIRMLVKVCWVQYAAKFDLSLQYDLVSRFGFIRGVAGSTRARCANSRGSRTHCRGLHI